MEDLEVEYRTYRVGGPLSDGRLDVDAVSAWISTNLTTIVIVASSIVALYVVWRLVRGRRPTY